MMKRRWAIAAVLLVVLAVGVYFWKRPKAVVWKEYEVTEGMFRVRFNAMGTITPKNKIVVTAPLSGRIERVLVEEGAWVKKGDILAWMSSADRVALVDAVQSGEAEKGWADMYKPAPVRSPVDGRIILKNVMRGQTVAPETSLYEISDILIVVSKVDEADIGKVRVGQEAEVRVDAFPDQSLKVKVERVGEQSTLANNVTSYDVFLAPEKPLQGNYRAGMSVTVEYAVRVVENALVLPTWITEGRQRASISLSVRKGREEEMREIQLGESNGENVEVLSGLNVGDKVLYLPVEYSAEKKGGAPFGMGGRRR